MDRGRKGSGAPAAKQYQITVIAERKVTSPHYVVPSTMTVTVKVWRGYWHTNTWYLASNPPYVIQAWAINKWKALELLMH
jgi:hypothetical protein